MINTFLGTKQGQTQKFLEDGTRIPVTMVKVSGNVVVQIKDNAKHGYSALQVGIGTRKNANKPFSGHTKSSKTTPKYIKEVKIQEEDLQSEEAKKVGDSINASDVLAVGDIVKVTGHSKGKGFAGGVKRYHFKGGPRTHGQSDRERAPGSIGQTTTPGRVYKGKKMAGKMGNSTATVRNLQVVNIMDDELWLMGLVPGVKDSLVMITKTGESKKNVPLYTEKSEQPQEELATETAEETQTAVTEPTQENTEEASQLEPEAPATEETASETEETATTEEVPASESPAESPTKEEEPTEETNEEKTEDAAAESSSEPEEEIK